MQRIGVTGILKGRGANVGWENQTWFDADRTIAESELREGLREVYPSVRPSVLETPVDGALLTAMLAEALGKPAGDVAARTERAAAGLLSGYDPSAHAARMRAADRRGGRSFPCGRSRYLRELQTKIAFNFS